jgi:lipopolysaccharide export LptBFGC system permease protein LptF
MNEADEHRRARTQQVAAFIINVVVVAVIASPLWGLINRSGLADAIVSGIVSGVLFTALWSFMFSDTVGSWIAGKSGLGRKDDADRAD